MNAKLTVCRGLQGSGKSYWAREQVRQDPGNIIRVNRDTIRIMLHDGIFLGNQTEAETIMARDILIEKFLKRGKHVICDDTNLSARVVKDLAKLAHKHGASVELKDFETPLDICIARDSNDDRKAVGEQVIRDTYKRYFIGGEFPKNPLTDVEARQVVEPYVADVTKPKAVCCDLDGTVAQMKPGGRGPYDYSRVLEDDPRHDVIESVKLYAKAAHKIIFVSGRSDICREDTIKWLDKYIGIDYFLYMRPHARLNEADYIIKLDIFNEHVRDNYNVTAVFDDRKKVLRLWEDLGLTTFNVGKLDDNF